MPDMPVLALDFKMKKQLCNFQYYGLGPDENYSDRCKGARQVLTLYAIRILGSFAFYVLFQLHFSIF